MKRFYYLFYFLIAVISIILIIFAINVFPIPGTDSRVFIPPALFYSKGFGLVNPLYDITFIEGLYKSDKNFFQFSYYVPLYPLILGIISKISPGIKTIFFVCSVFSASNLILYGYMVRSFLPEKTTLLFKAVLCASVVYIATYILPTVGRPENLSCLLIFTIYILYNKRAYITNKILYNTLLCLLFSFLFSTQIVGFYFCALFFVTYEVLNTNNIYRCLLINVARFTIISLGFLAILSLSPNGLLNTLNGIKVHGSWALTREDRNFKTFIYFWIFAPLNFAFLGIFACCAFLYIRSLLYAAKKLEMMRLIILILIQLVILVSIPKFILYASPTVYNATQFILPLSIYLLSGLVLLENKVLRTGLNTIIILCYIGGNVVFLRWALLFADYKSSGRDYDRAKAVINEIMRQNKNVRITPALWTLVDNANDVSFFDGSYNKGDIVIIQQAYARNVDVYLNNATILYDWRITEKRKFCGVPISATPHCYSFVVCKFK